MAILANVSHRRTVYSLLSRLSLYRYICVTQRPACRKVPGDF